MARTDQPLSEIAVANMAATTLDEKHLSSLDEDTPLGRFMASQFGYARDELLRSHPWAFAKTRIVLAPMGDAPPFGWTYQYQLPSDCLRLLPLRRWGYHNNRLVKYEREGNAILTDEGSALSVIYIKRVLNAAEFDPLFARALGERLALLCAQRITGKSAYVDKAAALYKAALGEAFLANALDMGSPEDQNRADILDARLGG